MPEIPATPDQHSFDRQIIESQNARIGLNNEGGYVTSWKVRNPQGQFIDVLYQGKTLKRTGIPLLFPNFGPADGIRQHGFGRDSTWKLTAEGNKATMQLSTDGIGKIAEGAYQEYPHLFSVIVTVEAEDDGSMVYDLRVVNTGNQDLRLSPGLHPYWRVDHSDKSKIKIEGIEGFDATQIDWDNNPPDTLYDYNGLVTVILPDKRVTIEDITDGKPQVKKIVTWSQELEKDDHDFLCVEPVCGKENAINENPIIVHPNDEFRMRIRFSTNFAS